MNNIEFWLIPVIMLLVWIVSSLARGSDKEKTGNRGPRSGTGDRPARERGPRSASDIDRFLEEVNRRRRQASDRKSPSPEAPKLAPQTVARPGAASAARPKPLTQRPAAPSRPLSGRPAPTAQPAKPAPQRTVDRIAAAEAVAILEVLPVATPAQPAAAPAPVFPATGFEQPAVTASQQAAFPGQLLAMLQGPQTLATAVVLHEVFGQPRCRRRRVR